MTMRMRSKLAVHGGTPLRSRGWPSWPIWDEREVEAVAEVARSGQWFSRSGSRVQELTRRFAEYHQARFAVPCTNGTHALEIALRAAGVKAGQEVILPPYTFIATATAIVQINAVPVFADIDPETYNLDPQAAEAAITDRTGAIIAVHIAGCPADMDALGDLARRRGLKLVEDAAQAHGAEWRGKKVGAIGDAGSFSFQASKNLNAGEGGIVLSDREEVFDRAWSLADIGRIREGAWYQHELLSGNFRMTEWQGAILLAQMERLEEQTRLRNENGLYLAERLAQIEGIRPLTRDPRVTQHAYHLFVFRYDAAAFAGRATTGALSRSDFMHALSAEGVPCTGGYTPLYRQGAFRPIDAGMYPLAAERDYSSVRCPVAERVGDHEAIWLMQNLLLGTRADMDDIVDAILKIQEACRG
jgi:dTDP-4-amino-4,6-dideoxygalactose transaminase